MLVGETKKNDRKKWIEPWRNDRADPVLRSDFRFPSRPSDSSPRIDVWLSRDEYPVIRSVRSVATSQEEISWLGRTLPCSASFDTRPSILNPRINGLPVVCLPRISLTIVVFFCLSIFSWKDRWEKWIV